VIRRSTPVLLLVLCTLWVHAASLFGNARLTAHHDNLDGAAPLRIEAARQWKSGHVPLWNPYKRAGMPLAADTTAAALYPGNAPFLFEAHAPAKAAQPAVPSRAPSAGDAPVFRTMDIVAAMHALFFLRAMALDAASSVLGALVYACSGTMGWFAAWYVQIQNSAAWLPFILLAVHRASTSWQHARYRVGFESGSSTFSRSRSPVGWIGAGAAGVALQWLAGFPETSVYTGVLAAGYATTLVDRDVRWRPIASVTAIYAAGLLLAAVQLVPALELASLSRRPAALSLEAFQSLPARASMVAGWLVPSWTPGLEFPPAAAAHFGVPAVLAALFAIVRREHGWVFFSVVLAIAFALSLGDATPLSAWLWHVPGIHAFRHPFKHLFELSFAMSVLAALGAAGFRADRHGSRGSLVLVVVAVVVSALSLGINQSALVHGNPASVDISGRMPEIATVLDKDWRVFTARHFFQKRDPAFLLGDYPTGFGIPAVHGAGPFLWSALADATGMVEEETSMRRGLLGPRDRTLALLSSRYVLQTMRGNEWFPAVDAATYRSLATAPGVHVMQRQDALPRVRLVAEARCADAAEVASSLERGEPDPARTALVDCSDGGETVDGPFVTDAASEGAATGRAAVRITAERAGHLELETNLPRGSAGFLVVSQSALPGWRAWANGSRVPIRRVHGLVQGLELPPGTTTVELDYLPRSFVAGATITLLTLAALLFAKFGHLVRRREMLTMDGEESRP
jgi:hypothetical protein